MALRVGIDATAIPSLRAGAGNYIFNLVQALAKVDRDNHYVIFAKPQHIAEFSISQPNFRLAAINGVKRRFSRLLWEQFMLPRLVQGYQLDVLHSPHYTMPIFNLACSVVTFHDMTFFLYPEMHGTLKRVFFRQMIRVSSKRADKIIAVSESTRKDILNLLNVTARKVHTVPEAASGDYRLIHNRDKVNRVCTKYGLQTGRFFLYVGTLEPRKNVPTLLRAYSCLVSRGIHDPLVIVGKKGWMFGDIFATVKTLKLEDKVVFTGYVPDEDLPYLYNGARLFVYPSLYEGFGLPVLEAMACGTPVITSNVSSMPEVVGDAGLLIDPRDHTQLAQAIELIITNDDLSKLLRERGLQRAAQFSWERTARETLKVYTQGCKDNG